MRFCARFRCRKAAAISARRRDFVDQLSRHPSHNSEFESLTYHHVSQLSNSPGCAGAPVDGHVGE
ncbi:hypothetical protein KCP74_18975 [Salmonella enterica subsp. enterica]|nr:hypothetical protein KCP74_18975 [Salmonella enterica subsp. enterica]